MSWNEDKLHRGSQIVEAQWHRIIHTNPEDPIANAATSIRSLEAEVQRRAAAILSKHGMSPDWHFSIHVATTRKAP